MSTPILVDCGKGATPETVRYLAASWRMVSAAEGAAITEIWRRRAAESPRDYEVHLYEVSDAESQAMPVGLLGLAMGEGGAACADLGPKVWFSELAKLEFIGWRSEDRIAWTPTPEQVEDLESQPGATEGGLYVERMAPVWYEAAKSTIANGAGSLLGGLANFIGEVFGKAVLAFLQTVGPWALVLLAGWLGVRAFS